jgi:23S rRNA G2445 N2-methylase RlmL
MSQPDNRLRAFVTTSPGLEPALVGELAELGFRDLKKGRAGVSLATDRQGLERLTVSTRLGHRVLWQVADVLATDGDTLYRQARDAVRWAGLIPATGAAPKTFAVSATCRDTPAFRDSRYAALRVKDAICDAVRAAQGERPNVDVDDPDVSVRVSIAGGRGIISLDAAGRQSLHARGYRTDKGEAPLRETLAAALPVLAGWDLQSPLVDPMCGSGTIVIEAALRAYGVLPAALSGLRGGWGFMRWPGHRPERFARLLADMSGTSGDAARGEVIAGAELDAAALATARVNAERAGVAGRLELLQGDARDREHIARLARGDRGLFVTNPPWGRRLGPGNDPAELVVAAMDAWREVKPGWRVAILLPDDGTAQALKMKKPRLVPLEAGALAVTLAVGEL